MPKRATLMENFYSYDDQLLSFSWKWQEFCIFTAAINHVASAEVCRISWSFMPDEMETILYSRCGRGGQVVSVLTYNYGYSSSNPLKSTALILQIV